MQLKLPQRQSAGLTDLAERTGRSADELAAEAVDRLLAEERWFDAQVQLGIDQIERGEFIDEEAMDARAARLMRG